MKRASDRKSVVLILRVTKAERAWLNKQRRAGELLSAAHHRILFSDKQICDVAKTSKRA